MTQVQLRTSPNQSDDGAAVLLDWFEDDKAASTVRYKRDFLNGLHPSPTALDLFRLGAAVYCADKVVKRARTRDAWTRDIQLQVPVSEPARWDGAWEELTRALCFLSGDEWSLSFVQAEPREAVMQLEPPDLTAVSLFSGGLDSLAGVIDLLEAGERLALVGHHDSPFTESRQSALFSELSARYGQPSAQRRPLYLRPAGRGTRQTRPLPAGVETTTRSRSFLFISAAVAVADAVGPNVPLYVPENGFIGINVPLTPARNGSLSTRTTHPLFMYRMARALSLLGLTHELRNPYRLMTKGEVLAASSNKTLLLQLAPTSISCSHPEVLRWVGKPQGNCGYCFPCMVRRAAMHSVGEDQFDGFYGWNALTDPKLLPGSSARGRSLRALAFNLNQAERREDVLANGRIPDGEASEFFGVYHRGRQELRTWLTGAGPELQRRLR